MNHKKQVLDKTKSLGQEAYLLLMIFWKLQAIKQSVTSQTNLLRIN